MKYNKIIIIILRGRIKKKQTEKEESSTEIEQ
jgi:hypothetical protein